MKLLYSDMCNHSSAVYESDSVLNSPVLCHSSVLSCSWLVKLTIYWTCLTAYVDDHDRKILELWQKITRYWLKLRTCHASIVYVQDVLEFCELHVENCSPFAEDIELLPDLGDRKPFLSWPYTDIIHHTHKRTGSFIWILDYQATKDKLWHNRSKYRSTSFCRLSEVFRKLTTHIDDGERVSFGALVFVCVSPHRICATRLSSVSCTLARLIDLVRPAHTVNKGLID